MSSTLTAAGPLLRLRKMCERAGARRTSATSSICSSSTAVQRRLSTAASGARAKLAKKPSLSLRESMAVVQARDARKQKQREAKLESSSSSIPPFDDMLAMRGCGPLTRAPTDVVQVNIGKLCNLVCRHCHVESGPTRQENMEEGTVDRILALLRASALSSAAGEQGQGQQGQGPEGITTVDITGGAPELNPHFRKLVLGARALGLRVIDRCNLSVLFQPGQEDTPAFLAANKVHILASLPSTEERAVERQRGRGAWSSSLEGLRVLNALGYGRDPTLQLDLIYNPPGMEARLPPPQADLEEAYRGDLRDNHGIVFNKVLSITNMPVKRYADDLAQSGQLEPYMNLLALSFSPAVVDKVMCRGTVSIGWDGTLYDCDFNQQNGLLMPPLGHEAEDGAEGSTGKGVGKGKRRTVWSVEAFTGPGWEGRPIATSKVCYGCTAGAGSSCGGALS